MKTPSVLMLVKRILKKLKERPTESQPDWKAYHRNRESLFFSASKLLLSLSEESRERKSDSFQRVLEKLFSEAFSSRYAEYAKSFIPYIDNPDFVSDIVFQDQDLGYREKVGFFTGDAVHQYYDKVSRTHFEFEFYGLAEKWFQTLSESQRSEILSQRFLIPIQDFCLSGRMCLDVVRYSNDTEVLKLAAKRIEEEKIWRTVFSSEDSFDPKSEEGKNLEKVAQYFNVEDWILHEISESIPQEEEEADRYQDSSRYAPIKKRLAQIERYFGHSIIPQDGIRDLMAEALSEGDAEKLAFYTRFIA